MKRESHQPNPHTMSRRRRGDVRPPTTAPALDDRDVHTADDIEHSEGADDARDDSDSHAPKATTQKYIAQLAGFHHALLPSDIEARFSAIYDTYHAGNHSDTDSEASEEERNAWWPLEPLSMTRADAAETAKNIDDAAASGAMTFDGDIDVLVRQTVHLSASLTRWRRRGTILVGPAPDKDVRCRRCLDVAAEPLVTQESHIFCKPCAKEAMGDEKVRIFGIDPRVSMKIDDLPVMCCHAATATRLDDTLSWRIISEGCKAVFPLKHARTHEDECMYSLEKCSLPFECMNPAEKCAMVTARKDVEAHRAACEFKPSPCPDCGHMIQARKMRSHGLVCGAMPVFCPYRLCKWRGKREAVDAHVATECLAHPVMCRLEDSATGEYCRATTTRERIMHHRASCQYQKCPCKFCGAKISLRRMGDHAKRCNAREFHCPLCRRRMPSEQRETHERTGCPMLAQACEHARFGCTCAVAQGFYNKHAMENFEQHVEQVAFGPTGVLDFINRPRDNDGFDIGAFEARVSSVREKMRKTFESVDSTSASAVRRVRERAEKAESSASRHLPGKIEAATNAFKRRAAHDRAQAEFALKEKIALEKEVEYHREIVNANLAGTFIAEAATMARERLEAAMNDIAETSTSLAVMHARAESLLNDALHGEEIDTASEVTKRHLEDLMRQGERQLREDERLRESRIDELAQTLNQSKTSIEDNIAHQNKTAEVLDVKLRALCAGERLDSSHVLALAKKR